MQRTLIHSARVVTDGLVRPGGWVLFDGETIAATGQGRPAGMSSGSSQVARRSKTDVEPTVRPGLPGRWL
jgi:hypothetical protein